MNRGGHFNWMPSSCFRGRDSLILSARWGGSLLDFLAMKTLLLRALLVLVFLTSAGVAQDVVPLYSGVAPGSARENYPEKEYFSTQWNTEVVTNVTKPTLTVFRPSPELKNGTAIVVAPGGGFMALSITSEGTDVA